MDRDYDRRIGAICEQYYDDVYYFLYDFTGRQNDAEDLTQEVFCRLLVALHRFDGRVDLKTWIFSIAKHVAIDQYRRTKFQKIFSDIWFKNVPAKEGIPELAFERKEKEWELQQAILELKPKYRLVIILRSFREYSVKETAEILGITEAQVKVDYHRAIKLIQKSLQKKAKGGWQHVLEKRGYTL